MHKKRQSYPLVAHENCIVCTRLFCFAASSLFTIVAFSALDFHTFVEKRTVVKAKILYHVDALYVEE